VTTAMMRRSSRLRNDRRPAGVYSGLLNRSTTSIVEGIPAEIGAIDQHTPQRLA
jgi:hypothetical protein